MRRILASVAVIASMQVSTAMAEPFGLLNGRVMNFESAPQMSVEGGINFGDDVEHFGVRFNYKASPTLMAYGDIGQSEVSAENSSADFDGLAFGIGAYMNFESVLEGADFAFHGSFHRASTEFNEFDADFDSLVIEGVFSGQEPLGASGNMFWNANVGIARISSDTNFNRDDSETELMFGAGVSMPLQSGSGELYGGLLYVDGMGFGLGYRHFLN